LNYDNFRFNSNIEAYNISFKRRDTIFSSVMIPTAIT
jgi:hypothetical protein